MITPALQWTEPARAGLERYFASCLTSSQLEGADAGELRADLEAHLEEELLQSGVSVVTLEDLRRTLAKMGEALPPPGAASVFSVPTISAALSPADFPRTSAAPPEDAASGKLPPLPAAPEPAVQPAPSGQTFKKPKPHRWIRFAGLWWPLVVFAFEVVTRGCAGVLFDPMPDLPHHLLVLLVPLATWLFLRAAREGAAPGLRKTVPWLAGAGLAAATYYMLCFLPVTPFALIGVIAWGVGLLALAPVFAFTALLRIRWRFRKYGSPRDRRGVSAGFWITAALVLLLELPGMVTAVAVGSVARPDVASGGWAPATRLVRRFGSERVLLRACYGRENAMGGMQMLTSTLIGWTSARDLSSSGRGIQDGKSQAARDLYFRVTGKPFDGESDDPGISPWFHTIFNTRRNFQIDTDRGGTRVAGRIPGLSLGEGRMDWHCAEAPGLTWGEWTMTFKNDGAAPQEARCRIALPPGGFVSRVTLWVNGQPQEAAYSTVSKVRAAYQAVAVVERRDPVLVTQPDEGSVLVQAFPVPAGGQLKTRITFTVPAGLDSRVWLPVLLERNFEIPPAAPLPLWVQADHGTLELPAAGNPRTVLEEGSPTVTASLTAADITGQGLFFTWTHQEAPVVFGEDPFAAPESGIVVRTAGPPEVFKPGAVAWVIDTSGPLAGQGTAIEEAVRKMSVPGQTAVFLPGEADAELITVMDGGIPKLKFEGGRDNTPALLAAMEWLRGKPGATLIWIHGPQPLLNVSREGMDQLLQRSVSAMTLMDVPVIPGENRISAAFSGRDHLTVLPVRHAGGQGQGKDGGAGDLAASLQAACRQRGGKFTTQAAGTAPPEGAVRTDDSLARWRACLEAFRLGSGNPAAASALAASHQIVTPWSGAVVLERSEDYARNGLTQSDVAMAQQIPSIPEPSGVLLLLMSAGHFLFRRRRS
ncbi:MAG: VIT domain-containing protein [Verrucomicrobiota bacterium]